MSNHISSPSKKAQFKFSKERFQYRSLYKQEKKIDDDYDPNAFLQVALTKEEHYRQDALANSTIDLQTLLMQRGVDLDDPGQHIRWLPLHCYDDVGMEQVFIDSDIQFEEVLFDADKPQFKITAKVLVGQGKIFFDFATILGYDATKERFKAQIESQGNRLVPRIYVCFDHENHNRWADRFAMAWFRRINANSLIKRNAYLQSMPRDHLADLPNDQKKKIEDLIRKNKKLEFSEISALMMDAAMDFKYMMNGILLEHHMQQNPTDLIPHGLVLPPPKQQPALPYYGMLDLESKKGAKELYMWTPYEVFFNEPLTFSQLFKEFLLNSVVACPESVLCLQQIKDKCNQVVELEFFSLTVPPQPYKLEEFKNTNDQVQITNIGKVRNNFIEDIAKIISHCFGQQADQKWFNLKETNRANYDSGRLKKFFSTVRLMIQDAILDACQRSFANYDKFIRQFVPTQVDINSAKDVTNAYINGTTISSTQPSTYFNPFAVKPLFTLDLIRSLNEEEFTYSTSPKNFTNTILMIINKALDDLTKIPDIEPKLMHEIFKGTRSEMYYKVPQKSKAANDPFSTPDPFFFDEHIWVNELYDQLSNDLEQSLNCLDKFLKCFDQYKAVLKLKPEEYAKKLDGGDEKAKDAEKPKETEAIKDEIIANQQKEKDLLEQIPDFIQVGYFKINCKETCLFLAGKYTQLIKLMIEVIQKRAKTSTIALYDEIQQIKLKLNDPPGDIEKLTDIKQYMLNLPNELEKLKEDIDKSSEIYDLLEPFKVKFNPEDIQKRWYVFGGPKEILELVDSRTSSLEKDKVQFLEKMKVAQEEFIESVKQTSNMIGTFYQNQNINMHESVSASVRIINDKLAKYAEEARQFNSRELLFELEQTDYSQLQQMQKEFKPYSDLWLTTNKWFGNINHWMNDEWEKLDADYCEKFMEESYKTTALVNKFFTDKDIQPVLKIGQYIRAQLEEFRPKVPLMVALRKQGMLDRHWEQVSEKAKVEVKPGPGFTFTKVLELGLLKNVDDCMEIGERAYKEYQIETMLNQMMSQWENINFDVASYKGISYIIRGFDEIGNTLDEHIVNTYAMAFSPFKKPFEEQLTNWSNTLKKVSDIFEVWGKVQVNWMYLQPIFDSADISKQLPIESKKFKQVDTTWKHVMQMTKQTLNVIKVCSTDQLLEKLQESFLHLEQIQKELNNYLERKRERFARFYFLSNDDLLEILSQTKEPTAVQPHLRKVFENIFSIEFDDHKKIHAMFSAEGEKINFVKIVDPNGKNVEDWMTEVEDQMKQSVRAALLNSVKDYEVQKRIKWVTLHPGQCVLNGSQVHWTKEVEEAIKTKNVPGYTDKLLLQMDNLVDLVRTKLTKMQMVTINALIVIDVHAKDVVELIKREQVEDVSAFEWISQLRYYWETDNCFVKCIQTNFPYGYEYLGNTLRLVITPLTDKCYMTLMGALKLNLGGAPAGPAGTGKTESTKDLAKALAKQCVVFNCSDQMDYIMVGKFFKGLAAAGAWACFDEFNRINIEVLSVIAQQLLILFGEKAKGSTRVEFEGSDIRLEPTFSVFITMNPGYAGRTELPDNLKALFRPVAMMVPDYALIGEIMLYSFGFKKGRELAKKMVYTFKLSSEQLSSQDHYDYGMRAVRSVINAAGLLKAADPDEDEDRLLLRALQDVNVPKFLKDDLPLFNNIIKDLFPGISRPEVDMGELLTKVKESCTAMNLQCTETFLVKVFQLYDTIQVRHGLMIVGPTGGGKTSNYCVLQRALTSLASSTHYKVHTNILNPKSITMGQLYGQFNEQTREWNDGILAYTVREVCRDQSSERHWIMFDGPVDAIWIESMNTVLDDNKKLCLNSGQILTLTAYMTMMFEVEDLAVASPATVSRCGMVYMEPVSLGLKPLVQSWLNTLPKHCLDRPKIGIALNMLFDTYLEPTLEYIRKSIKEIVTTFNNNLTQALCRLINCYLNYYRDSEVKKITKEELDNLEQQIEPIFIFSLIWSIGCTGDSDGRDKFNTYFRGVLAQQKSKCNIPAEGTIYEYQFNEKLKVWTHWNDQFKGFEVDPKLSYSEILIPTTDSTRNMHLMKTLMMNNYHVLFPGPTGTGKTLNAMNLLMTRMGEDYQYISLAFSAQTSANQTQDTIDNKLTKRRKGYYGPPPPKKCIIFVDDLNMPKKEEYGAQPPIELLRQYMDHKGWYHRKELFFMNLQDIILLSAMGPPGGGRTAITNRFMRHYNIIAYTELDDMTIKQIFKTLVSSFLKRFSEEVRGHIDPLVDSVLYIYETVKRELLPTPKKGHYTFNLRDINKVFQGICSASIKYCSDGKSIVQLWFHENMRVFHDRLINTEDREYFVGLMQGLFTKFGYDKEQILNLDRIMFADFQQGRDVEPRHYYLISDLKKMSAQMYEYQQEYNADPSFSGLGGKKSMKLVLFLDACEHICRICRILRQPQGNALLLGVGGSGRQSLAKMATFISYYRLFQIEVIKTYNMRAWREDVKKVLMMAGVENKGVSFLFVDTQIINEQMLEDINSVLNSGDVTNLYQDKDMDEIVTACKSECLRRNLQPTQNNIFAQYLNRVRNNIHLVLAMSPLNEQFSTRLRMFPSLVNCCTIDWFTEWPEEALVGVGRGQLLEYSTEYGFNDQLDPIVEMCKIIHKSVEHISVQFQQQLRRYNYVTPTSFLELINMFKLVNNEKRNELKLSINRLKSGLDKLIAANEAVAEMQIQLTDMQPKLEIAAIETDKVVVKLEIDKKAADEVQKVVLVEEAEAQIDTQKANELKLEAEGGVAEANRMLDQIMLEVSKLKKEHLVEVRSLPNPPRAAIITLGGCVVMLQDYIKSQGGEILQMKIEGTIKKEDDYFSTAKKYLLNDTKELLEALTGYDKENINQAFIRKLEAKFINDPDFKYERAQTCSHAVKYLFLWCQAMYDFNKIFLQTQPLRDKLKVAEETVAQKTALLKTKKEALEAVNAKIKELQDTYEEKLKYKEDLQKKIAECEIKLIRAVKLTSGLSDEKVRWSSDIGQLTLKEPLVPGNSLISAAMLAYAGPFVSSYRQALENKWRAQMAELDIKHSEHITMSQFLGVPVKIQSWNIAGLPKDDTSTENGIIIDKSRRYPLMIDPQNQANKFVKNMGKEHTEGIEVLKVNDVNLMRTLELAVQFGKWVLIENVGKDLDPSFDPILLQQVVKSGSSLTITLGEKTLAFNDHFKFFMTTTIPNPHYPPETFVKVTIINFAITPGGLEDQMLAQIVALENPQLEANKVQIVRKNAEDKKQLLMIEDDILKSLSEGANDINEVLMDETLINKLQNSKKFAAEINQRVADSKITEEQIDFARNEFRPVAFRASQLFFCIVDLSGIDPMYQYSLQWFINLFCMGVENAPAAKEIEQRLTNLNDYFTYSLYENVCRSLFEKHKLLFSLLLTVKILQGNKELNEEEWRYLLTGPIGDIKLKPNPTDWIAENTWPDMYRQLYGASQQKNLQGLEEFFMQNSGLFKGMYDSTEPHEMPLPEPWDSKLDVFQKLIFIKSFRPDKVIPCVQNYISLKVGKQFIVPPIFDLGKCYKDSTMYTPLIFVLSAGSDPVADFLKFAEEKEMLKRYEQISLGQGQGPKAEKMMRAARQKGGWVMLQNCHLAISWMPDLERICEDLDDGTNKDYRLWLTSMPTASFPISVLQNGVKMTLEPPQGLRSNLLRTYAWLDDKELTACKKPDTFKKMIFGFCFFHAIIQDRRKFGPIGWNIAYEFTNEDLQVCKRQLQMLLDEYDEVPYKVLNYLGAEINYGGRVTDAIDVRLIKTILSTYINKNALIEKFAFSKSGKYCQPVVGTQADYMNCIESLPLNPEPEVFGLHENADITNAQNQTLVLLETILSVQPRTSSGSGKTREETIEELANFVQGKTPPMFDFEATFQQYPTDYQESMNTVLVQEVVRYNRLLEVMIVSLVSVKKALKGLIVMSEDLEKVANNLYDNQVPKMWAEKGFLSLKPLASWTQDLNDRVTFLRKWIDQGTPSLFWFSGLFFPQAFIAGMTQNYARKYVIAVDQVSFEYQVRDDLALENAKDKPTDGCYVYGCYLEGCRWDQIKHQLGESTPKELFSDLPILQLIPKQNRVIPNSGIYNCPLYKVVSRAGTLSTTGHSTNFVMWIELKTDLVEDQWIKAGVASFLSLRY